MPNVNPGAATTQTPNTQEQLVANGSTNLVTFAALPAANTVRAGTLAYTSDQGLCLSNGTSWSSLGGQANVVLFGADPTGTTDSTTAIQSAINVVAALGGGAVSLPVGLFKIGTSGTGLVISTSNVKLVGAGANYVHQAAYTVTNPATQLIWGGSSSTTAAMLSVATPASATGFSQSGNGASGIEFNCNSLCGYGVQLVSQKGGSYSQLYVLNPLSAAYQLTTLLNASLPDDSVDSQHNVFTQCYYRNLDSAASIKAHGFQFTNAAPTSSTNGNSSFNTLIQCVGLTNGLATNTSGIGYKFDAADNNDVIDCIGYRTSGTTVPTIQLNGNNPSSDGNVFIHFSDTTAINAINILGNATLGSGYNPTQNIFYFVDASNGVNYPTLDTGCRVGWVNTNNINQQPVLTGAVSAGLGNDPNALAQVANVSTMAHLFYNASQNHVQFYDNASNKWGINIDGSGNARFSRVAGSGNVVSGTPFVSANTTAPPASGSSACGMLASSTANLGVFFGTGAPTFSAAEGALYSNTTGGVGTRLYINTSSVSGTTWTALTTL